jgi:hypothetical protein
MFAAFIPGPYNIGGWQCQIVDDYETAHDLAMKYFTETGIIVAVEEVAQRRVTVQQVSTGG